MTSVFEVENLLDADDDLGVVKVDFGGNDELEFVEVPACDGLI